MRVERLALAAIFLWAVPVAAGSLSGTVTRSDTGAALAGATVLIRGTPFLTTSGVGGSYSFPDVPNGSYGLACSAPGLVGVATSAVWIADGTVRDFALEPAASNRSTVGGTTTCGAALCAGVYVTARAGNTTRSAVSDSAGQYAIGGLGEGTWTIRGVLYGHLPATGADVVVPPPADAAPPAFTRDLVLNPGGPFTVTGVVGLSDNPLDRSGSTVRCNGHAPALSTTTDSGGGYVLEGVPAGSLSFTAFHTGYQSDTDIDVSVASSRELNFILLKDNGQTDPRYVLDGVVTLQVEVPDGGTAPSPRGSRVSLWSQDGTFQRSDITGGQGGYSIGGIDPDLGPFMAGAAREGFVEAVEGPFGMGADRTLNFTLEADPDYDWGPGSGEDISGCGCAAAPPGAGALLPVLALLVPRRRKWS